MAIDLKQTVRNYVEQVFHQGNLDYMDEICAPDYTLHDPLEGRLDLEGAKRSAQHYLDGFSDRQVAIENILVDGGEVTVVWRARGRHTGEFFGISPTNRESELTGITVLRFEGEKIVEERGEQDALGMLMRLGILPPFEELARGGGQQPEAR
jgi:predicted ester cyclase